MRSGHIFESDGGGSHKLGGRKGVGKKRCQERVRNLFLPGTFPWRRTSHKAGKVGICKRNPRAFSVMGMNSLASYLKTPRKTEEELSYRSVPLERAFTVRVQYRYRGEMKPRCVDLDE